MKRPAKKLSKVAAAVPSGGRGDSLVHEAGSKQNSPSELSPSTLLRESTSPPLGTAAATTEAEPQPQPISKASAAMRERWRKIRAGELPNPDDNPRPSVSDRNPLFDLPDKERAELYAWLRECPEDSAIRSVMNDYGLPHATIEHVDDFFRYQGEMLWETRFGRAAEEANALVRVVERWPVKFSPAILAALGQEAFKQISRGSMDPESISKFTNLFLKARSDERADQMQELKREKVRQELQDGLEHAMERLFEEVEKHPAAKEAFEALRRELATENG